MFEHGINRMNAQELAAVYARLPIGTEYSKYFKKDGSWKVPADLQNVHAVLKIIGRECEKDAESTGRCYALAKIYMAQYQAKRARK